jgi:hypothetical protein
MQELKATHNTNEDTITLSDIVQFIKASYKKILLLGFCGLVVAVCYTFLLGQYTASITLMNYAQIDIPRIKYLQVALPKLSQEESVKGSENYLDSEQLWKSAIKVKSLIGKSDAKDILDPASLQSERFNIYAIEVLGKANAKQLAEERAQEISNYFISGTIFVDLRDLVRQYELTVTATNAKLATKILNAEVDLAYIDRRIKSLTELKTKYFNGVTGQSNLMQLIDAKDSGAKYLPILTQIIAAKADQNDQNELLLRYKEDAAQMRVYGSFLEKAKPFMNAGLKDPKLITNLLDIVSQASKDVNTNYEKVTLSKIDGDLMKIMAFELYGLRQVGAIGIIGPAYLKNAAIGLFGGTMIGILLALGLLIAQRLRTEMKSAKKQDRA